MRKLLSAVAVASLLVLAGCGTTDGATTGNAAPLSSLTIKPSSEEDTAPEVTFDTPLEATEAGARLVVEGDGEPVKENQTVGVSLAGYNAETGEELGNTFADEPRTLVTNDELKEGLPEVYEILIGAKIGSYIAYVAEPVTDPAATDGASSAPAEPAKATEVLVFKVESAEDMAKKLSPEDVAKLKEDGALPSVEFAEDGKPAITIPEGKDAPKDLAVDVIEEGDGAVVTPENTVKVNYHGVRWEDGEAFDSSYEKGEPLEFPLSGVIPGWTQGLTDVKVGSTVLLTVPGSMAYGETEEQAAGRPAGTLVFVVEVLEAK